MQTNTGPTLSEPHLQILQTLDNEIEVCVHLHAYTAAILASRNFLKAAATFLGSKCSDLADQVDYLSRLDLVMPEASHWAELAKVDDGEPILHSVTESEAARMAGLARVVLAAIRRDFQTGPRIACDTQREIIL